ncbi:MAG: ABC transporter substrate-binding protein [Spirochaetes bacterium GWD1_27_9]|nr:MAG: ABC transporter substrate-binding protein [Spirochaetes bacterium GWB1_27_13]OHD27635.1 MAG: ABC transporter substrate-binding protein [Spirochaetes bacterium GWC1_27_15]OHD31945.1 MAG: ABC transporter substrate-binding protein [Spirochaetes bacterium GWD1_27_9]
MKNLVLLIIVTLFFLSCTKEEEYSVDEINTLKDTNKSTILSKTVKKFGPQKYKNGKIGGVWVATLTNDPKTFNTLTARDSDSRTVIDYLYESLADYDPYKKEFIPNLASFEVKADEENDKLDVIYKLRDDLYWTTYDGKTKVKVTADDVVFWYNEIAGEKKLQLPDYSGQFIKMKDGVEKHIDIEKIDDLSFVFHYPRIIANPILTTNMDFGPKFIFEKAKKEKGVQSLLELFSVDTDVKTIPSLSSYYIYEYTPGVRVVLKRNPNHWKKDAGNTTLPYVEQIVFKIVPDMNTEFLLFKNGEKDFHVVRPEDLDNLLSKEKSDYTVYNGGSSLDAAFFCFNQNPSNIDKKYYNWFSNTKFRQAMSCMINRDRIINQVYRGLAEPAIHFYAKANPFFDENIKLQYTYNPKKAIKLLEEIGIKKNKDGLMVDKDGNIVEFDIVTGAENNIRIDMANIFADELKNIGITLKVRPIDFQKLVDSLIKTYDWHCVIVGLGANYWATGGINVWLSSGNFHLWRPLQEKPATDWEARIDHLYNEGAFTLDKAKAKKIWDEYQQIILEQVPLMYIVHPYTFRAVRNKWENVYFDNLRDLDLNYIFLK